MTPETPPDFAAILEQESGRDAIPDHVEVAPADHLSLGGTLGEGLPRAVNLALKTAPTLIPLVVIGYPIVLGMALLFVVLVIGLIGGLGALLAMYGQTPSYALAVFGGYFVSLFVLSLGFMLCIAIVGGPFQVALFRSHWRAVDEASSFGVLDGIRGGFRLDLWFTASTLTFCRMLGLACLIVPGILFEAMTNLVLPAMIIDGLSLPQALWRSLRHFLKAPFWHLGLGIVEFILEAALSTLIPLFGSAVHATLQIHLSLHAYRVAFPATDVPSRHLDGSDVEPG